MQALGDEAGEFLKPGEAVELKGIEDWLVVGCLIDGRLQAGLRLDFDLSQLASQPCDAVRELEKELLEGLRLDLDTPARDADFPGLIYQAVESICQ